MPQHAPGPVKAAREATVETLAATLRALYEPETGEGERVRVKTQVASFDVDIRTVQTLPQAEREWVWQLFERNMRSLYERSAEGYDAQEKRTELFHPESRFLIVRQGSDPPLGYCIFRFDTEETASEEEGEDDMCDVVYCYELQIEAAAQRRGAGRLLMQCLERLGRAYKMEKAMLTAFKHNADAVAFYQRIGFEPDAVDPSQYGIDDVDYVILSKDL
ncbi:hypothetical protein JCM8202_004036 [Rhodotorula sphaerocarpa]